MKTNKLNLHLLIFTILIFSQFCYALEEDNKKPFVTCSLNGQLGNQLHQIATTLAYAWDNDMDPIFPDLNNTDLNISINSKRIFFRLNSSSLPHCPLNLFEQYEHFEKIAIPVLPDQHLMVFFQNVHTVLID